MTRSYDRYKDIPLGIIIKKDLRKKGLSQKDLAHIIGMSYCRLNKAINGHSYFSKEQAHSIDHFFEYEESFSMRLQINDRKKRVSKQKSITFLDYEVPHIRPCVFWDTDLKSLDWIKYRKFIERRISMHGNEEEKTTIAKFYASLKSH